MTGWPGRCLILVAAGLAILAVPARFEGPVLLEVGEGHALSVLDLAGLVPLLLGSRCLHAGLWSRRRRLEEWVRERPWRATATLSAGALGLGMLLASAFSHFFWWWAVGAALFVGVHVPVVAAASRRRVNEGPAVETSEDGDGRPAG